MSKKISALPTADTLDGMELVPIVQSGVTKKTTSQNIGNRGSGSSYLIYTALVSQANTSDPVVIVLGTNTIGNIVWTRLTDGQYQGTLSDAFPLNKTAVPSPTSQNNGGTTLLFRTDTNAIALQTSISGAYLDNLLSNTFIEIRVYP